MPWPSSVFCVVFAIMIVHTYIFVNYQSLCGCLSFLLYNVNVVLEYILEQRQNKSLASWQGTDFAYTNLNWYCFRYWEFIGHQTFILLFWLYFKNLRILRKVWSVGFIDCLEIAKFSCCIQSNGQTMYWHTQIFLLILHFVIECIFVNTLLTLFWLYCPT